MGQRPYRHHSFILSLWHEGSPLPNASPGWHYSLEDPHGAERRGFKDLADLARFWEAWTVVSPEETTKGNGNG